jgi:hypothetical protein
MTAGPVTVAVGNPLVPGVFVDDPDGTLMGGVE